MGKVASGAQARRETVVPDNAIYAAMGVMAAVIEEPHCLVGADQLRQLVHAHGRLHRAVFGDGGDYRFVDGAAVNRAGHVIKRPVCVGVA